ncbi:hypothetical protein NHX12_006828 [Muraenolepis orangiensis]|uniref:Uncharacterized protein n=1 Tax=Muraenolepis orangiensis TaxID=630683 RepID=A0A9Q0DNR6_9TELE|nr:hypothetical protein NHX12_006828 [Muraenolepis orangiensis]
MAMFGKVLEPVGFMQTMRVLVQGICSYLEGAATQEEAELARKNLDYIDKELGAGGQGLLCDQEIHDLEWDLAVVYYQLGAAVRAQPEFTQREKEVFLHYMTDHRLERQLTALHARLMGLTINFVLGTGLLCLLTQASLTGRDQALLTRTWSERMGALYRRMKTATGRCSGYYLEQAEEDVRSQLRSAQESRATPEEAAAAILDALEKNYDWLCWAVMLHPAASPAHRKGEEPADEEEGVPAERQPKHFLSVASEPPCPQVVACFRDTPTSLDKSRIHQLIVDLEWKIPNPPPEVYAAIEGDPGRAQRYLAARMLSKLQEGLGAAVAVHVVPGRMEMKCNFPPASYFLNTDLFP